MPASYEKSVSWRMYAAYYLQQKGGMARLLPVSLYRLVCLVRALLDFGRESKCFIMPYLELCITARCSLRCTKCANLMQYYRKPRDFDAGQLVASIERLLGCVDFVDCFRILGGEPLLHRELAGIVRYCTGQDRLGQVQVVTNGTIIPNEELLSALQHDKASVYISDYGKVTPDLLRLQELFDQRGIANFTTSNYIWDDMGEVHRRDYSPQWVRNVYGNCTDICKTLLDAVVYVCPRSAHGEKLGLFPSNAQDHVDLFAEPVHVVRRRLRELYGLEYVEACYHCNAVEDRVKITAGEQCRTRLGETSHDA